MSRKAEIIDTQVPYFYKAQLIMDQPANKIFEFIANPANHSVMDGSGMVKGRISGPKKLYLGAKFGMRMLYGIPYAIRNQVIEFEDQRVIAWRHILRNIWRYELTPLSADSTLVVESWDGRNALLTNWPTVKSSARWVPKVMAKTLVALDEVLARK
ncbi:MAG: polyketide cyclase / dehydrase and lipid transport [Actinobacteria bacterium]|nr:polyketide cyclase / dehydrase and lipid transport [Actinomycetota bacterium]